MRPILIDPGHGGRDPGATVKVWDNYSLKEKDYTLKIGLRLHDILRHAFDYPTVLTRTSDTDVSLEARTRLRKETNSEYLVSLHINSFHAPASGYEVWVWERSAQSVRLGKNILEFLYQALSEYPNRGLKKTDSLYVLRNAGCRAALVEFGFLNDEEFRDWLEVGINQNRLAWAVGQGLSKTIQRG